MGIRQAVGIVMIVASLAILGYYFYVGAAKGMIGCYTPTPTLYVAITNTTTTVVNSTTTIKTITTTTQCSLPSSMICGNRTIICNAVQEKILPNCSKRMRVFVGRTPPPACSITRTALGAKVVKAALVKKPLNTMGSLLVVAAWMGLIVGPWLAFGETPTTVGKARR